VTTNPQSLNERMQIETHDAALLADRSDHVRRLDAAIAAEHNDGARGALLLERAITQQAEADPSVPAADSVRAFELLVANDRADEGAFAAAVAGAMLHRAGDLEASVDYAVEAMALVTNAGATLVAARAANSIATLFAQLSAFEQAYKYSSLAADIHNQNGEPLPFAMCYTTCYVCVEAHHAGVVLPLDRAHQAAAQISADSNPIARKLLGPGMAAELSALYQPDLIGEALLDESELEAAAPRLQAWFRLVLAVEAHGAGDAARAVKLLDIALPTLLALGDEHRVVRAYRLRSAAHAELGDVSSALADALVIAETARSWQVDQVGRLAVQIARRAELEQQQSSMQRRAIDLVRQINIDALTRTGSRRMLDERLDELERGDGPVSVAVVDIDEFKSVNDKLGHAVGDAVLKRVGKVLRRADQSCAVLARYGGDEFIAVFRETGTARAAAFAEEVRETLSSTDWEDVSPGLRVHASAGVASGSGTHVRAIVERADAALYSAKRRGRNRCVVA